MGWMVDVEFRPSRVHGTGVFARRPIAAGTRIWQFDETMQVCDQATLAALPREALEFALHGGYLHHPTGKFLWYADGMQFMNHASGSGANIGLGEWPPLAHDNCIALRDIAAGEELLEDYCFWSIAKLAPNHWLKKLYREFCPHHYDFLMSLEVDAMAA